METVNVASADLMSVELKKEELRTKDSSPFFRVGLLAMLRSTWRAIVVLHSSMLRDADPFEAEYCVPRCRWGFKSFKTPLKLHELQYRTD